MLNVVSGHVGMIRRKVRVPAYTLEENICQLVALNRSALKILIYLIYGLHENVLRRSVLILPDSLLFTLRVSSK